MTRKTLSVAVLASLAVAAQTAFAAEPAKTPYGNRPQEIRLEDTYALPSVFVEQMTAGVRGGTVGGQFTVLNEGKEVIGNLQYQVEIYGDLPGEATEDPQLLFAESDARQLPSLVSGERRNIDFSYDVPALPEGTYTVRIQILHGGSRELGWANARLELGADTPFVTVYGQSITLPEFEGKAVAAQTGPNVDPEAGFAVNLGVFNAGNPELVVVPVFTLHRMDLSAPVTEKVSFDPMTIPSADSDLTLHVTAPKTPGVYAGSLTLTQNGKVISSIGQYRFVVRGLDADIISARLANVATKAGETAFVRVDFVGPADAETTATASLHVAIKDAAGIAGEVTVNGLTLNDGVAMGTAKVTLSRDLGADPVLAVSMTAAGRVLTENISTIALSGDQLAVQTAAQASSLSLWASWYTRPEFVVPFAFALLFILAVVVFVRRAMEMKNIPAALRHGLSYLFIVTMVAAQLSPVFAYGGSNGIEVAAPISVGDNVNFISGDKAAYTAYWSQVWTRPIVALFVNRPIHNSTIDCRQPVPLEFRIEYAACNNIPAGGRVIARYDQNGNHQSTLTGVGANWIKVFEDVYFQAPNCPGTAKACIHTKNYNTTFSLAGLTAAGKNKTTLQVVVKHNAYIDAGHGIPDDTISPTDIYFQRHFAQAFNIWLTCSPICGNGTVESGEQCDDGNTNNSDTCSNQCQLTRCGDGIVQNPNGNGQNEQCDDGNTNNNDSCSNQCQLQAPDVEITKTSSVPSVPQGGTFNYTLTARNNGPIAATNVVVTDAIPSTLTITSVPSGCTAAGNNLTCNIGNLAVNATRTFTVGVSVPQNHVCPANVNNTGVITATGDVTPQNNQSSVQTQISCVTTDIEVQKTAPATLSNNSASNFNYTLTVTNNTSVPASGVQLTDSIPAPLTITSVPSGCSAAGNNLTCSVGTLAGNATRSFTVGVSAPAASVCGQTVTNTVTAAMTTADSNPANNQASAQTQFTCTTDIRIEKTAPATLNNDAASSFNYTLTVTNLTAVPAQNVVITDAIPAPLSITLLPPGCTAAGNNVTCSAGTLAGNGSRSFTIGVSAPARSACNQTVTNTASVATSTTDTNGGNNQASADTDFTCTPPTDIEVQKTAPATLNNDAVNNFNYTVTVRNLTSNAAQNVTLNDTIPAAFTITSVPGGCNANGNAISCPIGTLGANATRTFTIGVSAAARSVCGQTITNTAAATTSTLETTQNNNQASAQTQFTCTVQTDLRIQKTGPATVNNDAVSPFNYTLTVTNLTSTPAQNVVVTDTVPAPFTITVLSPGCTAAGNNVTCQLGTLGGNGTATITIGVSVPARTVCSQTLTNTATVETSTQDTNAANNQSSVQTQFTCTPPTDIEVQKTAPATLTNDSASSFNYTVTLRNLTANAAQNVTLTDVIPQPLVITALPAGCSANGNTISCPVGQLAGNATRTFTIGVQAPARSVCSQTVTNTASATTSTIETNQNNNQASAQTQFTCTQQTDIKIEKSAPGSLSNDAASPFTYTLTVTNLTSVPAANVVVTDTIPQPLTVTSVPAGCSANGNTITCSIGTLAANDVRTFSIGVSAPAASVCGQTVTNTAYVTTSTQETSQSNNQASAQTSFFCNPPQFTVYKNGPAVVSPNELLTYLINVTNTGPTAQSNIQLVDQIPAGLTFTTVGSTAGCVQQGGAVVCPVQTFQPGQTVSYTLKFTANSNVPCNSTILNSAVVKQNNVTVATSNQWSTTVQCSIPKLDITKTAPATVNAGGQIVYTFALRNTSSTQTATQVELYDFFIDPLAVPITVPPFTFVSISIGSCDPLDNQGRIHCNLPNLAPSQQITFTMTFSVPNNQALCGQTVINQVDVWTQHDEANADWDKAQTVVQCAATDVSVTKYAHATYTNDAVTAFNYSITVRNNTSVAAQNVVVTDTIPSQFTVTSLPAGCARTGNAVTCQLGTLAGNAQQQILIGVSAPARSICGQTITNTAYVTTTTQETNTGNNQGSSTSTFTCTDYTDVQIVKTAPATLSNDNAAAFNYTLAVTNLTAVSAANVTVTDTIPSAFTITSVPAGCTAAGNAVTCSVGTLAGNQSRQYVIGVSAAARAVCSQNITNTASVTTSTLEQVTQNNQSSAQTSFTCTQNPRLYITKAGPATVNAGGTITYNFTLQNTSAFTATDVYVYDYFIDQNFVKLLPAPFTFVSSSGLSCWYDNTDQRVECSPVTLTAQQMISFTMTFSVPNNQALCNQTVTNKGETIAGTNQQTLDGDTAPTTVICAPPQFTLTKIGPSVVSPGELLTYIITATNTGPTAQNNIQMYDDVPAGTTFEPNGSTAGCVEHNNHVYCAAQTFQPGQSVSYTLKFRANQNVACNSQIINEAELEQNGTVFLYSNKVYTDVQCTIPKLDVTKSAPATVNAGGQIVYTFALRNTSSTQTATQVELYDFFIDALAVPLTVPPFTFVSISTGSCDPLDNQGRIRCDLPDLAPSQQITFTMTFSVPNNQALCNQTVINQVDVWTQGDIANADWDKAQTVVQCAPQGADVSITKTGPVSVVRGNTITYALLLNNAGPATATNVVVRDAIPSGLTYVSATGAACSVVGSEVQCSVGSLPANTPMYIYLTFATQAPGQSCTVGSVQNTATVTATTTDPNTANNSSTSVTSLTCPQPSTADVSVLKTGPASVVRGDQISYNILVQNSGPSTATGISISDLIPSGFTYVSATGASCVVTGNQSQVGCTIGTLNSGGSALITLTFSVPTIQNCTQTAATNTVTVSAATPDPNTANNQSSAVTTVTCPQDTSADVAVLKFGPASVVRGNQITYSLIVTNYGPGTAQGVVLSDPIPSGLTFVSSSGGSCSLVNNALQCQIGSLPSGQSSPIISATFLAPTVQNCTQTSVTNTATVTATSPDPQGGNNTSSAVTTITCPAADTADLNILKSGTTSVQYGSQVVYTINVMNFGPSSASGVTVSDTIPLGLTYVSASGATCQLALPGGNPNVAGFLSCDIGALVSGGQKNFQLVFSTTAPQTCTQTTVINSASVSENDPNVTDPNSLNNQSSASTVLTCPNSTADLSVTKSGPSSVTRGNTLSYTLTVTNSGPASATNVVLKDPFSSELTYSSASGATCSLSGNEVQCQLGTLTSGQSVTVTLNFTAKTVSGTCSSTTISNTGNVTSSVTDPNTSNNTSSTVTTTLTCPGSGDFSIYKTDNRTTANVYDRIRYSIIITNPNNGALNSLLVTDPVPYGLTILTVSDGGTVSGQQVRWTDISVPANSSRTLYIDAEVSSTVGNNTVLRNTVDVNGKQATDETTVYNNNYNPPPPYYPPYTPPPYYPPYTPPPYYPPVTPPPYYPPVQPPPTVIYPQTGDEGADLYGERTDDSQLTKVTEQQQADDGYSTVFYATLMAIFAAGSAVLARMAIGGL